MRKGTKTLVKAAIVLPIHHFTNAIGLSRRKRKEDFNELERSDGYGYGGGW